MRKSIISLAITLVVIAGIVLLALLGLGPVRPVQDGIILGLDLVGGSEIVYEPIIPQGMKDAEVADGLEVAKTMLRQRADSLGYTEANVYTSSSNRIVVEIPSVNDPEEAVNKLGATAVVTFEDDDGKVWLKGEDITSAKSSYGPTNSAGGEGYYVQLELTPTGQEQLRQASVAILARTSGTRTLSIKMDGETISAPGISQELNTSTPIIELGADNDAEYALYLSNIINAGRLPFELTAAKVQTMGASLGEKSLTSSLFAGLLGLLLVMLFMLAVYRLMGLVSCISLLTYTALFAVVLSVFHVNLSLPGIAGIILTLGMAVDANVIIFERIKEELRLGKTLRYAVDSGYKRAFTAILDSNITTIIAAIVLLWQGTGTILGFARTLLIGVVLSMLVMLILTKLLLKIAIGLKITNLKLYCAREGGML